MHKIIRTLYIVLSLCVFLAPLSSIAATAIKKIDIRNNKRIESETIKSYLEIEEGDEFDQDKVNNSLKEMFATGLFEDISVSIKNSTLIIDVQENPIINDVIFEGNKRLGEEALKSEINLKSRSVYTKSKVQKDVKRLINVYSKSGRFSASIDPKIVKLDQNRVDLIFEVDEGKKATVSKIYIIGNEQFEDSVLEKEMNTKESRWYRFYSSADTYDSDKVAYDKELLRKFYISRGYADFRVTSSNAELANNNESFVLTITLEEGNKYEFGTMNVTSTIKDVDPKELEALIQTTQGKTFNANLADKTIEKITAKLNNSGYAFVEIKKQHHRNPVKRTIGITYAVAEGPKVYINRVNILGNVRTYDKVIRREMRISEGDPFNAAKIRRSRQRIQNLGFFDKVDVQSKKTTTDDKADIEIDVTEKSTGELNFGAGFSTADGVLGNVSIRERNLLGKGQDLRLSLQQSARATQIDLGFTEPYFMGRDVSAGFDLFTTRRDFVDESSYDSENYGGAVRASYSLTEHLRHSLRYSLKQVEITDVQADASSFIRQQEGENTTSMVDHSLLYDRLNNRHVPTGGYFLKFAQEVAGLGGDSQFFRNTVNGSYYYPLYKNDVILSLTGKFGHVFGWGGKDVRIDERFFIGGNSLRGFKTAGIGPRDSVTRDALGGNTHYTGSVDVTFPLGLPEELGFKGGVFLDAGNLFNIDDSGGDIVDKNEIRASVGFGIAWSSPLGPIRIDLAHPFAIDELDRKENVRFNFGTRF